MIKVVRKLKVQDLIKGSLNVPVKDFLNKTGISRQTYYDFMTGRHRPTMATLNKICDFFGVAVTPYLEDVI